MSQDQNDNAASRTPRERAERIKAHIERHIGTVHRTFAEVAADPVRIDVHHVDATAERPLHALITAGMSAHPMHVPQDVQAPRRLELGMTLPQYWQLDEESMQDEVWNWPVRQLGELACLPHRHGTWLGWGHAVPHGEPPRALASDTQLCGAIIAPSLLVPKEFYQLTLGADEVVFYSVIPLYAEEMELQRREGMETLLSRLIDNGIRDVVDPHRRNVAVKKRFRFFGR